MKQAWERHTNVSGYDQYIGIDLEEVSIKQILNGWCFIVFNATSNTISAIWWRLSNDVDDNSCDYL